MINELKTSIEFDRIYDGHDPESKYVVYFKRFDKHHLEIIFEWDKDGVGLTQGLVHVDVSFRLDVVSTRIDGKEDSEDTSQGRLSFLLSARKKLRFKVYALLEKAIHDFAKRYQPDALTYTGSADDKARIKLFDRIGWKFAKKYGYVVHKEKLGPHMLKYEFYKKDKGNAKRTNN